MDILGQFFKYIEGFVANGNFERKLYIAVRPIVIEL
jgi:hypothetical protein